MGESPVRISHLFEINVAPVHFLELEHEATQLRNVVAEL